MNKLPVGIQVYNLRNELENKPEKFPKVMEQIKAMGYDGVELAGMYNLDAKYISEVLELTGLVPISAHVPLVDLMNDLEQVISDYTTIGVKYIAVPYLPEEYRHNTEGYPTVIEAMKNIGIVLKEHGIKLQYHNHDFEFVVLPDGTFGLDDIYSKIGSELLKVEPDTCWIKVAGQDPVSYIRKYAKRCEIIHLKDFIKEGNPQNLYKLIGIEIDEDKEDTGMFEYRPIGFGQQLWEPILDVSLEVGAKWVIVEQDEHYDISCLEAARRSREYLKILGW